MSNALQLVTDVLRNFIPTKWFHNSILWRKKKILNIVLHTVKLKIVVVCDSTHDQTKQVVNIRLLDGANRPISFGRYVAPSPGTEAGKFQIVQIERVPAIFGHAFFGNPMIMHSFNAWLLIVSIYKQIHHRCCSVQLPFTRWRLTCWLLSSWWLSILATEWLRGFNAPI